MPVAVVEASASVTGREIIRAALSFHLNRLSPGEAEDADLFNRCLLALNFIVDEFNGRKAFLFKEKLTTSSAITGTYGVLGTDWLDVIAGEQILGATVQYAANLDVPMEPITVAQYADIGIKSVTTYPQYYAHDGADKVYLYPKANAHVITIRTHQLFDEFDMDSGFTIPNGYKSGLAALLAEAMAPSLLGSLTPDIARKANAARTRLSSQNVNPAIMHSRGFGTGPIVRIRRGY